MPNEKPHVEWMFSEPMQIETRPVGWILKTIFGLACAVVTAAFLFPVFAVSRGGSHQSCLSHVKQLGIALRMYQEDYDGRFPQASEWMDATYPYDKNKSVYRCTSVDASHPNDFGYAFNASLSLKALDKSKAPEKIVVLYDSNDLRWNAYASGRTGAANPPRHKGMNNFAFADGHVKAQYVTGREK
jgi:prepilin-type processing-associated H-X9-DG protein